MSDATGAPAPGPGPARFGPIEAFQRGIQNYTNFEGRANRPEFWWWVLAVFVINLVASVIDQILGIWIIGPIGWIVLIVFFAEESKPGANEHGEPSTIGQR